MLRHYAPADGRSLPLIVDSPHSGSDYPDDFAHACARDLLRRAEDAFVDRLFAAAPSAGAELLVADFPRAYVDPNREEDDLDPAFLAPGHGLAVRVSPRARRGFGLVRRYVMNDEAIYARPLDGDAVRHRLVRYYRPYRRMLDGLLARAAARHGAVWYINAHSMKAVSHGGSAGGPGRRRPDINLGDRQGRTCDPAFSAFAAGFFRARGLKVALNAPYQGASLVRRHGDPANGRQALQIEISRGLYMDEERLEPHAGFDALRETVAGFLDAAADFVRAELALRR